MVQINLDAEEARVLAEALKSYLSDLRMEVAGTDSHDFREGLKRQEASLRRILEQVEGPGDDGGGPG